MVPEAPPPHRHVSSKQISTAVASSILSTYLANSEAHPHLHPDALITPTGVTFSSHGGQIGGVVMHNLRRVDAGLRGEYLEPEPTPEPEQDPESQTQQSNEWSTNKKDRHRRKDLDANGEGRMGAQEEGWQDMSEYEREEGGVNVGEIGVRQAFVTSGGDAPEVQASAGAEEDDGAEVGKKRKSKEDKEARKKAKKLKNKEFQKQKEKSKKKKGEKEN